MFGANVSRALKIPLPSATCYTERSSPVGADADLSAYARLTDGIQIRVIGGRIGAGASSSWGLLCPTHLDGKVAIPKNFADAALG